MRISDQMVLNRVLAQVARSQFKLAQVQERVGSGLRIQRASDDPVGTGRVMAARTTLERSSQYLRNIAIAEADMGATEAALARFSDVIQRANELSVQAANAALGAPERDAIAQEVAQLVLEAVNIGNTSDAGRYIFAGHLTDTAPYVPDDPANPATVAYAGDTGLRQRELAEGTRIAVNITGDRVIPGLLATLIQFRDDLFDNDVAALSIASDQITSQLDAVLDLRAELGAGMRRVEMARTRIEDEEVLLRTVVSQIEEVDLAESIVELQMQETAYQAALGAASRSLSLSILDFLR